MGERLKPSKETIKKALEILNSGGTVVIPTNTNYNVVCDYQNLDAVKKVFMAKERTKFGPLTLYLKSSKEIPLYTFPTAGFNHELADRLWPTEISFILLKRPIIADLVTCGTPTIALACHDHPVLQQILSEFGRPICGSSANISGQGDIHVDFGKAQSDLANRVDLLIDDGPTKAELSQILEKSNTIVDFTFDPPFLVRKGFFHESSLRKIVPNVQFDPEQYHSLVKNRTLSQ